MLTVNRVLTLVFGLMFGSTAICATFPVYVYHDDAPYFIDAKEDLSEQWVRLFNQKQSQFQFQLQHIARPDLNALVEKGQPYLILWANELWFKYRDKKVMSSSAIFWDADTLVSILNKKIHFRQAQDLEGLNIGVRFGHYYSDLNPLFKAGRVTRVDAKSSFENYQRLKAGQIDGFVDSRSTILYMQDKQILTNEFHVSLTPQDAFSRHLLLSHHYAWMLPQLNQTIEAMKVDKTWQAHMQQWGLMALVDQFELELEELDEI